MFSETEFLSCNIIERVAKPINSTPNVMWKINVNYCYTCTCLYPYVFHFSSFGSNFLTSVKKFILFVLCAPTFLHPAFYFFHINVLFLWNSCYIIFLTIKWSLEEQKICNSFSFCLFHFLARQNCKDWFNALHLRTHQNIYATLFFINYILAYESAFYPFLL